MTLREVAAQGAPRAIGPYAQAVACGGFLFLSGQVPIDPATGDLVRGTVQEEVERVLDNLQAVLSAAGCGLDRIVRTTVYLTDLADFGAMNETYGRRFGNHRPARSTVQVAALPRGARVEIDAIAAIA
jgi:2-iminobutanoate/2-iminopropanoate deaminase